MIQLYSLATPNGQKISVALEELGLSYTPHTVNILKGEQFTPAFVAMNPNAKIPVIIDEYGPNGAPITIVESGAILLYLAEKTERLISKDPVVRLETIQWVFFQMANIGPMFGQFGHFFKYAPDKCPHPYPLERYTTETQRLLQLLETHLQDRTWLVGEAYSIADIAIFPWVNTLATFYLAEEHLYLQAYPIVQEWLQRCLARPAVKRGMDVCSDI
jgi:GST-like protein